LQAVHAVRVERAGEEVVAVAGTPKPPRPATPQQEGGGVRRCARADFRVRRIKEVASK